MMVTSNQIKHYLSEQTLVRNGILLRISIAKMRVAYPIPSEVHVLLFLSTSRHSEYLVQEGSGGWRVYRLNTTLATVFWS